MNFYNNSLLFIISHVFDSLMRSMYKIFTNKNLHVSSPKQLLVELQKVRNIDMFKEKEDSCLTTVTKTVNLTMKILIAQLNGPRLQTRVTGP